MYCWNYCKISIDSLSKIVAVLDISSEGKATVDAIINIQYEVINPRMKERQGKLIIVNFKNQEVQL